MFKKFLKRLIEKMTRRYRVTFVDDEKLAQSKQYTLKPITAVILTLLLFSGIVAGTSMLIIFTPSLRVHIPDCLDPELQGRFQLMQAQLDTLERQIEERDSFILSYQRMLEVENDMISAVKMKYGDEAEKESVEAQQKKKTAKVTPPVKTDPPVAEVPLSRPEPEPRTPSPVLPASRISAVEHLSGLLNLFPPIDGKVRKPFNEKDSHFGVDFVADENALVRSATNGYVIFSEYSNSTGYVIGVAGENDVLTFYKHNSRNLKRVGTFVYAGEAIAVIGNSGENSTGPHLHFELWFKGEPLDPMNYFSFN
jgi:murein DD-endopeptidase MepM/ murein hydrolase activator NlpD